MPLAHPSVSTGRLPHDPLVRAALVEAQERFRAITEGAVATYIPALGRADPTLFGIALAGASGPPVCVGDSGHLFTIQSVSKPFVFALVCQAVGAEEARRKLGVNSTGLPFDSRYAVERSPDGRTNPMVNAGAIAATSLAPGATADEKWNFICMGLSQLAGRALELDDEVYRCEAAVNEGNIATARLLLEQGRIFFDPVESTDVYTRQCSLLVTARDLAVMAATLANGGVNPLTGDPVIDEHHCPHVLAVMVTAGLYETSGDWLYDTGLPGKSGGIVAVAPGKAGIAAFSPPLDPAGNSVRGRLATAFLSAELGLNLFASRPAPAPDRTAGADPR
jgi:glutaminase